MKEKKIDKTQLVPNKSGLIPGKEANQSNTSREYRVDVKGSGTTRKKIK